MKIRFKRILCPIDFDRISIPALELAVSMARQNKGRVYLLYIIPKVAAPRLLTLA
jgi:nucleotide-binding universal stress UspA family protein